MIRFLFSVLVVMVSANEPLARAQVAEPAPTAQNEAGGPGTAFRLIEHRVAAEVDQATLHDDRRAPSVTPSSVQSTAGLSGRARFLAFVRAAELRHALPAGLLDALVAVESAYRPDVISRAGAMGLAQLMPATARSLDVFDPFDVRANLDGGARFLKAMLDKFGSVTLALAAYNAGPGAVLRAGGIPANAETPLYVRKVLLAWGGGGR